MADHVWFVPVSGGRGIGSTVLPAQEFSVQWYFQRVAGGGAPALASVESSTVAQFLYPPGPPSGQLRDCYGRWVWPSCAQGGVISLGGQLAVGTVFSRKLQTYNFGQAPPPPFLPDPNPPTWNTVEAWVKFRVDTTARLSNIYFVINDSAGNWADPWMPLGLPQDWLSLAALGGWRVAWTRKIGGWEGWNNENLRATIHFPGTLNPANVGGVVIDIEWFAFRLSDQVSP